MKGAVHASGIADGDGHVPPGGTPAPSEENHMSLTTRLRSACRTSVARIVSIALMAGVAWLGLTTTAAANQIAIYLTATIDWVSDFPLVPSSVSGVSSLSTDARGEIFASFVDNVDPVAGPTDVSPPFPLWIDPGETIFWTFDGTLTSGNLTYPVCADGNDSIPGGPCNRIPIVTLTSDEFGSFSVTGPILAFGLGDPVQIGTWEIHSHEHLIAEPPIVALLGLGLAGLGLARLRDGPRVRVPPV